jgi:predicted transcriptional regulator
MMDRKFDTTGKHTFVITENGKVYLEQYKRLSELAEDFGLEL